MIAGFKINHGVDYSLDSENPTFIIVYNFHGFNEVDLVKTNDKDYMRMPQTVGCWNVKYKEQKDSLYHYYGRDMLHMEAPIKNDYIDTKENILNYLRSICEFVEGTTEKEKEHHIHLMFECYTTKIDV